MAVIVDDGQATAQELRRASASHAWAMRLTSSSSKMAGFASGVAFRSTVGFKAEVSGIPLENLSAHGASRRAKLSEGVGPGLIIGACQ